MHGIDLVLVQNGSVERTSSITYELYIALTSFAGESCRGEHRNSVILSLCMVMTSFLVQSCQISRQAKLCMNYTSL